MRSPDEQERFLTSERFERSFAKDYRLSMGIVAITVLALVLAMLGYFAWWLTHDFKLVW